MAKFSVRASDFAKLARYQTLTVTWVDIHVLNEAMDPDEYMRDYKPCIRRTAGFFLGVKHGHLFLAETDDRRANTDEVTERINAFPLQNVLNIQGS